MKVAILKERRAREARVAASPESVRKLVGLGCSVCLESGAGLGADLPDTAFEEAGAALAKDAKATLTGADVVLKVQRPMIGGEDDELGLLPKSALLIGIMDPLRAAGDVAAVATAGITAFAMDLVPRITRAQSMDVLSSQANLAGYKAVIDAAAEYGRAFPMMMTAAGTIAPARALIMGAGVAGLQAIATARRLGAIVSATDVRPAVKEQVESLGASFVAVEDEEFKQAETAGGYAKEMSAAYRKKQAALIAETIAKQDIVVTTALIPGRPAPKLVTAEMVKSMKPGAVIVDLAVETGGNCELSEAGKVVAVNGVKIVGHLNMPGRLAADTSQLYARNLFAFVELLVDKESKSLAIDWDDEIVQGTCVTRDGDIVHPIVKEAAAQAPAPAKKAAAKKSAKKTAGKKTAGAGTASAGAEKNAGADKKEGS